MEYPAGAYVVRMHQPLRALANTMLWDGEDISEMTREMSDISARLLSNAIFFAEK